MQYKILAGHFHVCGYQPDGDSIRFEAQHNEHWEALAWHTRKARLATRKQIRFEAIDALETHYQEAHQPRSFGLAALEVLLHELGIDQVVYNLRFTTIIAARDAQPGFLACQATDGYDRPISLVFDAEAPLIDGAVLSLPELPMANCVNLRMLERGLVYPTFYSSMEPDLLDIFTRATCKARQQLVGLWALDRTGDFVLQHPGTLSDDVVILPKLFRRLTTFFESCSNHSDLQAYLASKHDRVLVRETGLKTDLASLTQVGEDGRHVSFAQPPETLIFDPKK